MSHWAVSVHLLRRLLRAPLHASNLGEFLGERSSGVGSSTAGTVDSREGTVE